MSFGICCSACVILDMNRVLPRFLLNLVYFSRKLSEIRIDSCAPHSTKHKRLLLRKIGPKRYLDGVEDVGGHLYTHLETTANQQWVKHIQTDDQ